MPRQRRQIAILPATQTGGFISPHIVSNLYPSSDEVVETDELAEEDVSIEVTIKRGNLRESIIAAITIAFSK